MRWIGQYQVIEEIGWGAGGIVYRALDPAIGRDVAIKELRLSQLAPDEIPEARQRFIREAQAVGSLRHDNIVTLYQFIEEKDSLYLVMEFVPGGSLQKLISSGTPLAAEEAFGIIRQVARALDRAHASDIVHRDIKPGNILVSNDRVRNGPLVKVTDFGIARISSQTMTTTGVSLGTPAYMAPEQIKGSKVGARADQFSLAVVAYQLFGGRLPFNASSDQALMYQIVNAEPASLKEGNPDLPPEVDHVIRRALAKDPDKRFTSCGELGDALEQALSPPVPTTRRTVRAKSGINKRFVGAAGALMVVVAGLYLGWRGFHGEGPKPGVAKAPEGAPSRPSLPKAGEKWRNPKDGLNYVWIPPGDFMMGCSPSDNECDDVEKSVRMVTITKGFWLGQTEVTQAAYRQVTGQNPSKFKGDNLPVENVSWNDANSYCDAVGGRLPMETEWEYAARAGTIGSRYAAVDAVAWYGGNIGASTHPVGLKQANAFGLSDMLGNVWEWTANNYDTKSKMARGGSWGSTSEYVRASGREGYEPTYRKSSLGFRCGVEFGVAGTVKGEAPLRPQPSKRSSGRSALGHCG